MNFNARLFLSQEKLSRRNETDAPAIVGYRCAMDPPVTDGIHCPSAQELVSRLSGYCSRVRDDSGTISHIFNSAPTLATWGAFAGVTVIFLVEPIPIVRRDILSKLPVVGSYWENKVAASQQVD